MDLMLNKLREEKDELKRQNDVLRQRINDIYKSWLFDSERYTEIKNKYDKLLEKTQTLHH